MTLQRYVIYAHPANILAAVLDIKEDGVGAGQVWCSLDGGRRQCKDDCDCGHEEADERCW